MRLPLAALAVCLAMPALAQERCAPRDVQTGILTGKFGESVIAMGLTPDGVVEYWANPETGTWTVTITRPDGILCGIIAGLNFEAREAAKPGVDG
jgi:hypothetical protein